jgi:L-iditol 2-dehydrogenase
LLTIQAIRLAGCTRVIAVDINPNRLEKARRAGADHTLLATECNVPEEVRKLTGGRGADVALEVVGTTQTIRTAIDSTRKGGAITLVGNLSPNVEMPLQVLVTRELSVYGSCASNGEYPVCIDLLASGKIKVDDMITAKISLAESVDWFKRLHAGDPNAMKVIVDPTLA